MNLMGYYHHGIQYHASIAHRDGHFTRPYPGRGLNYELDGGTTIMVFNIMPALHTRRRLYSLTIDWACNELIVSGPVLIMEAIQYLGWIGYIITKAG